MTDVVDEVPVRRERLSGAPTDPSPAVPTVVTVVSDSPVVRLGVQAMLHPWSDLLLVTTRPWACGDRIPPGSVVLADTGPRLSRAVALAAAPGPGAVLLYGRDLPPDQVRSALGAGCAGHVDLGAGAADLRAAIQGALGRCRCDDGVRADAWAGRDHGLSRREAETLVLVCQGLTNSDIAARLGLTLNTVKSYLRTAYRKIGAARRPEAVRWGVENGLLAAVDASLPGRVGAHG